MLCLEGKVIPALSLLLCCLIQRVVAAGQSDERSTSDVPPQNNGVPPTNEVGVTLGESNGLRFAKEYVCRLPPQHVPLPVVVRKPRGGDNSRAPEE